jgi:hypothetical protein
MNAAARSEAEGLWQSGPKTQGFTPRRELTEGYYKKEYFSMDIFKKPLTKYFNWNKSYTKPSNA